MKNSMLIVDDVELNRVILKDFFVDEFNIFEANDGEKAINVIENNKIDIILLDLIMPNMNGHEVISNLKASVKYRDIPIVVITASESSNDQIMAFEEGASDYITKPFIQEIVTYRVNNVLNSTKRYNEILEAHKSLIKRAEIDGLTNVYNRITFENICKTIINEGEKKCAFLVFDIDNFKSVNDKEGHLEGDHCLKIIADLLSSHFSSKDYVGRIGGDEFCVLMVDATSEEALKISNDLIRLLKYKPNITLPMNINFSVGISTNSEKEDYNELFDKADKALYKAKSQGKARAVIY